MALVNGVMVAMPSPDGYRVDLDNPQRRSVPEIYIITGVFTFINVLFMVQRLYTKLFIMKQLASDDWLLIAAFVLGMITIGLTMPSYAEGHIGIHGWELPLTKMAVYYKMLYIQGPIYAACGCLAKLSLLAFYLQLSPQRLFVISTWAAIAFQIAYTVALEGTLLFGCNPIAKGWDLYIMEGKCLSSAATYIATAVLNIVSDIIILVLPIKMVFDLQMKLARKFGLLFIFTIGSATVITAIVRAALLPALLNSSDQTWDITPVSASFMVETNLLTICASMTTLRKFFKHIAPGFISESAYGSKTTGQGTSGRDGSLMTFGGRGGGPKRPNADRYDQFDGDGSGSETHIMVTIPKKKPIHDQERNFDDRLQPSQQRKEGR